MIKILDTILQIENDSKAQVAEAQKKAREMREAADRENAERLNNARTQAGTFLADRIDETRKKWQEKIKGTLDAQSRLQADLFQTKSGEIERTADRIVLFIKNPWHNTTDDQLPL